jgi:Tfp pilus assembly protein PilF
MWWVASLALAAGPLEQLASCCRAAGAAACPSELFAMGPGSQARELSAGLTPSVHELVGIWKLRCAGGTAFEPQRTLVVTEPPVEGLVLGALDAAVASCFERSCMLPSGICLRSQQGKLHVVGCSDGLPPAAAMWSNPVRGPAPVAAAPPAVPQPSPSGPAPGGLDLAVPARPSLPCTAQASTRTLSNQQVDQGNDAVVAGDLALALDRYRAAITLHRCNAFAWAALGEALWQAGHPLPARDAFEGATALMPAHFHAWTRLGEAQEQLGEQGAAAVSFRRALEQKPGHAPALAGMARLQQAPRQSSR